MERKPLVVKFSVAVGLEKDEDEAEGGTEGDAVESGDAEALDVGFKRRQDILRIMLLFESPT